MNRISHDLPGVTQRIAKLGEHFTTAIGETQAVWKDAKGRAFLQQHTSDVGSTINQLVSTLSETMELFEAIAKKVQDPDAP